MKMKLQNHSTLNHNYERSIIIYAVDESGFIFNKTAIG